MVGEPPAKSTHPTHAIPTAVATAKTHALAQYRPATTGLQHMESRGGRFLQTVLFGPANPNRAAFAGSFLRSGRKDLSRPRTASAARHTSAVPGIFNRAAGCNIVERQEGRLL